MTPLVSLFEVIPGWVFVWCLALIAFGLFGYRMYVLTRLLMLGKPENRFDAIPRRIWVFIQRVAFQTKVVRDPFPGLIHVFIFLGFIVYAFGFFFMLLRGLFPFLPIVPTIEEGNIFALLLDIMGVTTLLAILIAAFRRWVIRPARVDNTGEAAFILLLIFGVLSTNLLGTACRLVADRAGSEWSPISNLIANGLQGLGMSQAVGEGAFIALWWIHLCIVFFFLNFVVFSKHMHLIFCPVNEVFENFKPRGELTSIDLENSETFGVITIKDYTWKQLLDLYACTECGRCKENCPTNLTHKPLVPKDFIHDLKVHLLSEGPKHLKELGKAKEAVANADGGEPVAEMPALLDNVIQRETVWQCTTCGYCQEHCPVAIEHPQKIIDLRRNLMLMESDFPAELKGFFKSMETQGNPYQLNAGTRGDWAKGLEVPTLAENPQAEILYWVGCAGSFDDRNKKVSEALVKVLKAAGVNFAILGSEEKCCGDPIRRTGNEYAYQMQAMENVEVLNGYGVKKIVTQCPHCANVLQNEYPQLGGNYEVVHYAEYVRELISQSKVWVSKPVAEKVAYHDPCYLGRYKKVYEDPRSVLKAIPGLEIKEMERNRAKSFCCGGGGGHAFMEEHIGERINLMRMDEALKTNPTIIGTACPYCLNMFEDAITSKGVEGSVKAMDLIELVANSIQ